MRTLKHRIFLFIFVLVATGSAVSAQTSNMRSIWQQQNEPILEYGRGLPRYVQYSPDGSTVLVTTLEGVLWRYDAHTFETIDHFPDIVWAFYSKSGNWLFTQGADETWAIRSADDPAAIIADGFRTVWQPAASAWWVTADSRGTALRPADSPAQIALGGLESVYFSPDATQIMTFDPADGFVLRNADLSPIIDQPHLPQRAQGVYWSPNSRRIAFFNGMDHVDTVDVHTGHVRGFTVTGQARYTGVQWSPDSTHLLDHDDVGNVRVWDAVTGQALFELPTGENYITPEERRSVPYYPPEFWWVKWSGDGSHIFRCASYGGDISEICHFYDLETGQEVGQATGDSIGNLNTDPEGRYFIASEGVFDASTGQLIAPFDPALYSSNRAFSPDGRHVMLTFLMQQPDIYIYDLNALRLERTFDVAPALYDYFSNTWSPDGTRVAAWGGYSSNGFPGSGLISFWDVNTGREIGHITEHILFGQDMSFSPDSTMLAAADNLGNIALFDTETGDLLHLLSGLEERAAILAWQPGGHLLATTTGRSQGYSDPPDSPEGGTQVQIWDTYTGERVATLEHNQVVRALLWHPSGRYLVSDDNTAMYLWDAETGDRSVDARMTGGTYNLGPNYRWTGDGRILVRGHYMCSHGGGDSLNFLNMTTMQHFGQIDCSGSYPYEWNEALGGIPTAGSTCESVTDEGSQNCRIVVSILLLEPFNTPNQQQNTLGRTYNYDFGAFNDLQQVFVSPDDSEVAVVTNDALQFWRLGTHHADLRWTGDPVDNIVWGNSRQSVALVTRDGDGIRIVATDTGAERAVISTDLPDISSITWSGNDDFILVGSEGNSLVFEAASGLQIPLPEGIMNGYWEHGFLRFSLPTDNTFVWWDVRTRQIAFAGDQIPSIVSDDEQFGAENRSGMLRLWRLGGGGRSADAQTLPQS